MGLAAMSVNVLETKILAKALYGIAGVLGYRHTDRV
jgi:hypothetical protein